MGTPCLPSYRGFTLWIRGHCRYSICPVTTLSSDFPGGYVFASRPHIHLLAQTAGSLSGRHSSALASLQVDRLDASESLRKQEEHVVEPAPLLFGR